jgi:hypothetical protein
LLLPVCDSSACFLPLSLPVLLLGFRIVNYNLAYVENHSSCFLSSHVVLLPLFLPFFCFYFQIGIFVSGPVSKTENIEEILRSYIELNNSNYIGLISDEANDTDKISQNIYRMLHKVVYSSRASYIKHETFRGIAGKKIFRDDMIGGLKGIFQADHKYYKKHGFYDFPQKNYRGRFFAFIIRIISLVPVIRANFHKGIKEQMIANYKKYL